METTIDVYKKWRKFLSSFVGDKQDIFKNVKEDCDYNVEIINFFDTNVKLNDSYGFLTLDFRKSKWNVQDFLKNTPITFNSTRQNGMTIMNTSYSKEHFPCRVFGADNVGRIRFYQSNKIEDLEELYQSFLTVFRSVCIAFVNLKIYDANK